MPGTTRTFTYTLIPDPDNAARTEVQVRKVMGWACDGDDRITCHEVSGAALGAVTMSMTIRARDRWWATQLAQDVLDLVLWGLKTNATRLDLQSRREEPHSHRGYQHGRTKTYREARSTNSEFTDPGVEPFGDESSTGTSTVST